MSSPDSNGPSLPNSLAYLVAEQNAQATGQVALAFMYIVAQLKRQPNFDVEAFNRQMIEGAESMKGPDQGLVRSLLQVAAGRDPEGVVEDK